MRLNHNRNYSEIAKSQSFPNALVGNPQQMNLGTGPDEAMTGHPIKTFEGDNYRISSNKAFTLTELMIVVFIIGVMAAFAIPNYTVSVERSHRRDAQTQLQTIWSAEQIYRSQQGVYWPPDNNGGAGYVITDINNTLGLGIIPNGMTYSCVGTAPDATNSFGTFTCTAVRQPSSSFTITVTQAQLGGSNPSCSGSCP